MKTIAVQSYKGGVGKTTIALLLAKSAVLANRKTCVIDFDFMGSGMNDLIQLRQLPHEHLERFFLAAELDRFDVSTLLGSYTDSQLGSRELAVILNLNEGPDPVAARRQAEMQQSVVAMIANEQRWGEIGEGTKKLLDALASREFELAILDCHPGLEFISEAVRPLAQLNVYVTTTNRGDCFGLIKKANLKGLEASNSFLVLNRAAVQDLGSFRQQMEDDPFRGVEAKTIFGNSAFLGAGEDHFAAVPKTEELEGLFLLGSSGHLPQVDDRSHFAFCGKVLQRI
jgi:hypothetical protein